MNDSDDDADPMMPNDDYGVCEGNDFQQTTATHNIDSEQVKAIDNRFVNYLKK